ncbi:sterol 26-hydroxylase, mitochondrial-like [Ptychodera flava]|uniref:sterol 26-hydroxylase, mitochondrial-like n=1 Tax=Ptychodera flava TaxID=63121 RepID=UPI003969F6AA
MAFTGAASSSKILRRYGVFSTENRRGSLLNRSPVLFYGITVAQSKMRRRSNTVKSFSEMPGEGSCRVAGRLSYAYRGWMSRNTDKKPWNRYGVWNEKYGPIYKRVFGNTAMVYITDPEDIAVVCRNEGKYPTRHDDRFNMIHAGKLYKSQRNMPFGVLTANRHEWFEGRTSLNKKMMRPMEMAKYAGIVNDVITDLQEKIHRVRQADNVVPHFQMLMYTWAVESITAILFNKRLHLLEETMSAEANNFINGVLDVFDTSILLFKFPANLQSALRTKPWRKHVRGWDAIFDYGIKRVNEKIGELESLKRRGVLPSPEDMDILEHLLLRSDLSVEKIHSNMSEILLGSIDTTANALQWAIYNLADNPEEQQKLYEEVCKVVPEGEMVSYHHLKNLPYVTAVIKETLRIYPVVVNNSRVLDEDIAIKGYNIPAGTPIVMLFYQSGRDSKYFEDPNQFKPERWLTRRKDKLGAFTSMPFGFGPRMCIGKRFALLELQLLLSRISQNFVLENTTKVEPRMSFLLMPDRPLNPKFIDR